MLQEGHPSTPHHGEGEEDPPHRGGEEVDHGVDPQVVGGLVGEDVEVVTLFLLVHRWRAVGHDRLRKSERIARTWVGSCRHTPARLLLVVRNILRFLLAAIQTPREVAVF